MVRMWPLSSARIEEDHSETRATTAAVSSTRAPDMITTCSRRMKRHRGTEAPRRLQASVPQCLGVVNSHRSMRRGLDVLAQQIATEVTFEVAPDGMHVVAVVLRVVEFDQERRSLHAVIV